MTTVVEADVVVVGGGITAAMVAEKLARETEARVLVVEAGGRTVPLEGRFESRQRYLDYGDNPYPDDHIPDQTAQGIMSRSMVLGGQAMHWGGTVPRFTPEDFRLRSLYGIGSDWPLDYEELEPFYVEAEERIGVAGEGGPEELDPRSGPYPMPPVPLSWTLLQLKEWGERSGIPFWTNPVAKNTRPYDGRNVCQRCDTCNICPTGAKYSPEFTFNRLEGEGRIQLLLGTLVRRLELEDGSDRVSHARAVNRADGSEVELRGRAFVIASGYTWSSHLLLVSANPRFPDGLANRTGNVGRWMTGHRPVSAWVEVPMRLYPGMYGSHSLISNRFRRPGPLDRYLRHDLRIWESSTGRQPRFRDESGSLLLGDAVLADWRERAGRGAARLRSYYDVVPSSDSRLTLDTSTRNDWGDPLPRIDFVDSDASLRLREHSEDSIRGLFDEIVAAGGGRILRTNVQDIYDHPGGGCRMGEDPSTSVVDRWGRTHDHENLWVVGAPTMVSGGCCNGTLTFSALSLRSAGELAREFPAASSAEEGA